MPAQPQKPIDGRHVRTEILIAGVPQAFLEMTTGSTAKPVFDKIETKVMGQTGRILDRDPLGWEGEMMLNIRTPAAVRFIDLYVQAKVSNLPMRVDRIETYTYRDGTSDRYLYPNIELEYDIDAKRGSAVEVKVPWETGEQRVKLP